jgi:hypothetical protein
MQDLKTKLTKARVKVLLEWAFTSGKNNVGDKYFQDAIQQTINDMSWVSK